jgi:uncharacterized protein YndB with AHSA1/START domain
LHFQEVLVKRSEFRPSPIAEARRVGDRTLVLVRVLRATPQTIWKALTEPAQQKLWGPAVASRDLSTLGPATLMQSDGSENAPAVVRIADAPRVLEYTWDKDVVRWELEALSDGRTRVTLTHTVDDAAWLSRVTPGWHISLDEMQAALDGDPVTGGHEKPEGWRELADGYAAMLGVPAPD